tara:strand:- start:1071 stop:2516 length:1446 start_codon:yes stop_codon:yes gene_type:complete
MALYEDVIKYLNEKNKSGGTSGGIFDNYDESNNPFLIDFDKDEKTVTAPDAIPFDNPIVEAVRRDNDRNDPYNMSAMNNPNVRTQRNYTDPRSFMMDAVPKQNLSVSGVLKNLALNALPGMGMISMAKGIAGLLPANKRALMENELLGKGYTLDSLGRIVTDNYNSKEGVMAGLNANRLNAASFDKKSARIEKTLADKYGMTPSEIADAKAGTYKGNVKTDLIDRLGFVEDARKDILGSVKTAEELEEEINDFKQSQSFLQKLGIAPGIKNSFFDPVSTGKKAADTERARIAEEKRVQEALRIAREKALKESEEKARQDAIDRDNREGDRGGQMQGPGGAYNEGNFCFDPNTLIQMADGSTKKIKDIQLGDNTKGGEVTGVFQFKATDEIHDYKGVTVAGSHYVKEDGRFIMVKDSPLSVKIDKIPVVYSLDTSNRRIFINDIEFADYNGDGIAKGFLANAGFSVAGFDKEVLRQVENRLI